MPFYRRGSSSCLLLALSLLLAGCGGGSSSGGSMPPPPSQNPLPSFASLSPSVVAVGAPNTTITLMGSNFISTSEVQLNGTALATTFVSPTQVTATVPAGNLATAGSEQITVSNPSPGGGTSGPQAITVVVVASLVIMGTPANGGSPTGAWQLAVAAADPKGNGIANLPISFSASAGSVSASGSSTDSTGTLLATVSPPTSYSGQAVAVGAATGSQTAVINIAFVSSPGGLVDNSSRWRPRRKPTITERYLPAAGTLFSTPVAFGVSGAPGASNSFNNPDLCYSNAGLTTTPSSQCQSVYTQNNVQLNALNLANTVCTDGSEIVGVGSCVATAAIFGACALSGTGVGAVICVGGLTYVDALGAACAGFLGDQLAQYLTKSPAAAAAIDAIGIQPGPPSAGDYIGLLCDAVASVTGTGGTPPGTQISVVPVKPVVALGSIVQFSATVTGNTNTSVTWSVNGVAGGAGPYGTVSSNGKYTAPSSLPLPDPITVTATSVGDPNTSASAVVTVESASGSASGSTAIIGGLVNGQLVDKAYVPLPNSGLVSVVNVDAASGNSPVVDSIAMPLFYGPTATAADQTTQQVVVISYNSSDVQIIDASQDVLIATLTAPVSGYATFSGGSCIICGVSIDPTSNTAILDTSQGYLLLNLLTQQFSSLIAGSVAGENFGYNPNTLIAMNPTYDQSVAPGLQAINLGNNSVSTYSTSVGNTPDAASVDLSTNIAVVPDEYTSNEYLINMGQASFASGTFSAPDTVFPITYPDCINSEETNEWTMVSIESMSHLLFLGTEFGDCAGVQPLPTSPVSGAPPYPTVFNWGHMPSAPDGSGWNNGADPHGIAVFTSVVDGKPYGFLVRSDQAWVARIDMNGVVGAPPLSGGLQGEVDLTPFVVFFNTQ